MATYATYTTSGGYPAYTSGGYPTYTSGGYPTYTNGGSYTGFTTSGLGLHETSGGLVTGGSVQTYSAYTIGGSSSGGYTNAG